jgi:hypothetical protein
MTAFKITITMMIMVSVGSPMTPEMRAATISTRIMKSRNWSRNIIASVFFFFSISSLGPYRNRRRSASAGARPCSDVPSSAMTSLLSF